MPTKAAEDPAVVAALQAKAARSPRVYRFWLALIAIAGDFALTLTLVFPIAATIVIGVVLYPPLFWIGIAGIVFFVWLFRPTFRFHGRELIEPAPRLEEELAALKRKLGVPGRMRVYLDDSFNAAAMQTRGYFGIVGTRCGLILGVPLLLAVSREQLLAVIAHEFGHFSRRHGLLGQWLYRARVGWMEYAKQVRASDSLFDVATAWYAEQFVPYFSKRTFVESRQCEYEADADAMLAVGTQAFAQAMTRIAVVGRYWEKEMPKQVRAWQLESQEPPADFLMRFDRGIGACASAQLESWLNDEMRAPSTSCSPFSPLTQAACPSSVSPARLRCVRRMQPPDSPTCARCSKPIRSTSAFASPMQLRCSKRTTRRASGSCTFLRAKIPPSACAPSSACSPTTSARATRGRSSAGRRG
jgi:Zn-dependent protease with chaperone function